MNSALTWIKSNPITLIAGVVALVGICFFGYILWAGLAFRADVAEKGQAKLSQIEGLGNKTVEVPSQNPDQPPDQIRGVTINKPTLDRLRSIQGRMDNEAQRIFAFANQRNRAGHEVLVQGVFPGPSNSSTRIQARETYRQAFTQMFGPAAPDATGPRLNAGQPPTHDQLAQEVQQAKTNYLQGINLFTGSNAGGNTNSGANYLPSRDNQNTGLTLAQAKALRTDMRNRLIRTLRDAADPISIYADNQRSSDSRGGSNYPFQVDTWSDGQNVPAPWQLWEGQLELWIQQDLARAIAIANHVGQPGRSVVDNPVKRLLAIRVFPGYVGLQTAGEVNAVTAGGGGDYGSTTTRGRTFNVGLPANPYSPPAGGRTASPDKPIPVNFNVSPTGRTSNGVYDVRHAVLSVIVDYQQLPQLFNAIGQVNFMTVLNTHIEDVDEYQALKQGYVYGSGDAVRADLLIETVWLRDWTAELMPQRVREYVGIDSPPANPANNPRGRRGRGRR